MEPREIVSFVKMIKSYPALYNNTLPEYCDKELVDSSWKRVAKAHNVSGELRFVLFYYKHLRKMV